VTTENAAVPDAALVLSAVAHAVAVVGEDGRVAYWNPAAEALFGWTAEEAVGRRMRELAAPERTTGRAEALQALRSGSGWSGRLMARHREGHTVPVLATMTGLYDADGALVGAVAAASCLGAAIGPILERSSDAAVVLRADAVVTYASPLVEELLGWGDDVVGTSVVPLLHPDERGRLAEFMEQVVAHGGAHDPVELRVRGREGWVWCEAALTNLLDDPEVRGVVCTLRRAVHREALTSAERQVEQLRTALESRVLIEQAKGFLAARHGVTPAEGFEALRRHARSNHLVLQEAARRVVERQLDVDVAPRGDVHRRRPGTLVPKPPTRRN
jgi:PAS domain S-box-containing protein